MTSYRQIEANRGKCTTQHWAENGSRKASIAPHTLRHVLIAEMVIGTLEDADDYKATKATAISLLVAFVVRMVKRRRESSDARLTASSTI